MQVMTAKQQTRRAYSNTRRAAQAAQTRSEVLDAAAALFAEQGWAKTTLAAVAERAGVAIETIYSGFKSKRGLLRAATDAAVVGDLEPIPYIERPEVRALAQGPLNQRLERATSILAGINERTAGLKRAINEAAVSDDEIDTWRKQGEQNRRLDVARSLELVFGRPIDGPTIDLLSALYSQETYTTLIDEAGWTRAEYEQHMGDVTKRLVSRRS